MVSLHCRKTEGSGRVMKRECWADPEVKLPSFKTALVALFVAGVNHPESVARPVLRAASLGELCHGYVEAQYEYALQPHQEYDVNQYAQRIISTPGKQDGLAWQNADGSWDGPVGEKIAQAIAQGL